MGMESYGITLLADNVNIIRDKEYYKLIGNSDINILEIEKEMDKLCVCLHEHFYVYKQCIYITVLYSETNFQGFELTGCLSYLKGGINDCYEFYNIWDKKSPLSIYVLNQKINVDNANDLYKDICALYSSKIELFKKQYGEVEIKCTTGDFYRVIKKQNKWYKKLIKLLK